MATGDIAVTSNSTDAQKKVIEYFERPESRFGYDLFLSGSKHFGFYPAENPDISEKEAQILLQDLVAKKLKLQQGQEVLDAGCGQGLVSTYLAKKYGVRVSGITLVPFEVQAAKKRAKAHEVENKTDYVIMDYSATSFADEHFDAIYTTETLSHSPDLNKTLKEFFRILKPGGKVAFFEYSVAPEAQFSSDEKRVYELVRNGSAMLGLNNFRSGNFLHMLQSHGFKNAEEQDISENMWPSLRRLYTFAKFPYVVIKFFHLQRVFINTTAAYEYYKMAEKRLLGYSIFTANK